MQAKVCKETAAIGKPIQGNGPVICVIALLFTPAVPDYLKPIHHVYR